MPGTKEDEQVVVGAPSKTLLRHMAAGRVVPFVGAGFSLNAGTAYRDFHSLTAELRNDLSSDYHNLTYPVDITDRYALEHGEQELKNAVCDLLPTEDHPGDCHARLMSFPWRRVFTTNFDLLLEDAAPTDIGVAVTNSEYNECYGSVDELVLVKLCGDRRHKDYLRLTRSKLSADDMSSTCPLLFDDLIYYMMRRPFLFLGYSISDPFMRFVRALVESTLSSSREGVEPKQSYIVTFDKSEEEVRSLLEKENLVAVNLETRGRSRMLAIREFLELAANQQSRTRQLPQGKKQSRKRTHITETEERLKKALDVPVFATRSERESKYVSETLPLMLEELGRHMIFFGEMDFTDVDAIDNEFDDLVQLSTCAVFLYGEPSEHFDALAQRAELLGCQPIALCTEEKHLSARRARRKYIRVDHSMSKAFVQNEVLLASTSNRVELCEEYLRLSDTSGCVVNAWVGIEQYVAAAAMILLTKAQAPPATCRNGPVMELLDRMKQAGSFRNIDMREARALRKIRNSTVHDGRIPSLEDAQNTLDFMKNVLRSMGFDLPRFASKMDIFGGSDK